MAALGLAAAYAKAGFRLVNARQHWSAVRQDGGAVALSVWADAIDKSAEPWRYVIWDDPDFESFRDRPGQKARAEHIAHGLAACGGRFELILCRAKLPLTEPRTVEEARPWTQRIGLIDPEDFRPDTGEFVMRLAPSQPQPPAPTPPAKAAKGRKK